MESWLRQHFALSSRMDDDGDSVETVVVMNTPRRQETDLAVLLSIFGDVTAPPSYSDLMARVGDTGLGPIVEDWKERGLLG